MRSVSLFVFACLLAGCSLLRDAPNPSFLDNAGAALATPGESFVALSGGACLRACPQYQIFVFESGRVVFNGQQHTARLGIVELQTAPSEYYELKKILSVHRGFTRRFQIACVADRPGFDLGAVEGERMRAGYLNLGCINQRKDLEAITAAFIRISNTAALIG
jgi:uncharacterized protein DUF6438